MKNINDKKSILIVNRKQYGYHTDSYQWALNLSSEYNVTYICIDIGLDKIEANNVNVIYIKCGGNKLKRALEFLKKSIKMSKDNMDDTLVIYFPMCFLMGVLNKSSILDFRTGNVNKRKFIRDMMDLLSYLESFFYQRVTIISEGLRKRLFLSESKTTIVPLGAEIISSKDKEFNKIALFYIGVLDLRCIHETIFGLSKYIKSNNVSLPITYDIVGYGNKKTIEQIKTAIDICDLSSIIKFHGRLNHQEAKVFFDNCNVGVSYIPMTSYFDYQPPTKTHEYINSGMVCIGTSTSENKKIITDENGVFCESTAESFSVALNMLTERLSIYSSDNIIKSNLKNSWLYSTNKLKNILN
ncbi:hypothetical protein [Photobacterium carnosum]|uniref:hypothetical protein n=1 Tax=Photobacterium carnosum TaxID=2023717 RepID=UPI001E36FC32|nr:hypothetical protein [Photobacterium carnosum]MCD9497747.1 hypothetical protein [Photobacterium carnosum]